MLKAPEAQPSSSLHLPHVATSKRSNKHGDSRSQEREPVSTLYRQMALRAFSNTHQGSKPVARPCVWRFTSIYIHTSHFSNHTEITLQDVPNWEYTLRLFVENVERELHKKDDYTWTPVQRQYVPYFSNTYVRTYTHSLWW